MSARLIRRAAALLLLAALPACERAHGESLLPGGESPAHRIVAILDYIGADYAGAVGEEGVLDEFEHREQVAFAGSARAIAADAAPDIDPEIVEALEGLEEMCRRAEPPAAVKTRTREIRRRLVETFGLIQSPDFPPSLSRGRSLYATRCVACHGPDGRPPADIESRLKPPPRRLSDPEVLAALSPYRVYNALSFGIEGTAMPAFDSLSSRERWDLAFYVFTMREQGAGTEEAARPPSPPPLATLSGASDDELRSLLRARGVVEVEPALSFLRLEAPFSEQVEVSSLTRARRQIDEALEAMQRGEPVAAEGLVVDAYLTGIEPVEGPLRATSSELVQELEEGFLLLRAAVVAGDTDEARSRAGRLRQAIGRAEYRLEVQPQSPWLTAASGAILILREGVEAALLVMLLLAAVAGVGRPEASRYIHAGWAGALAAGAGTFVLARALTARVAAPAEIIEAASSLLASAVLFYVSHWLLGQVQSSRWVAYIKDRARSHVTRGRLLTLSGLAFLAVYREAVETILFFEGLLASGGKPAHALAGAAAGALLLVTLVIALRRLGARVPMRVFFAVSGVLLYSLCVILAGKGVRALVAAGWLSPRPLSVPSLPALGIYPDAFALAAQALLLLAVAASVIVLRRRAAGAPAAGA